VRPQPNRRDTTRPVAAGGMKGSLKTCAASPCSKASKFLTQRSRENHQDHGGKGFRRFARSLIDQPREAPYCPFPPWPRPFSLFLRAKRLAYFLSAARNRYMWVSIGRRKNLAISQRTRAGNDLGGSDRESVCYRRPGGNSSRAAVNSRVSDADGSVLNRPSERILGFASANRCVTWER